MIKKAMLAIAILGLVTACSSQKKQVSQEKPQRTTQSQQQGQRGQGGERPNVEQLFTQMDTNGDGLLSKIEVKGPLSNDFSKIDTNNDGFISKTELTNAPKPERGQGGPGGQGGPRR